MDGDNMYNVDLTGSLGLVIGSEGEGISRLVREKCDFIASIPMNGQINSLNASVAAGVLMYEALRQRCSK
jgi:23S rRNA (guanosine2251-2'-O)-methyltransferase